MSLFIDSRQYDLPPAEAKIVTDYLSRVRTYVKARSLSSELIDDLESNLAEKLNHILSKESHSTKDILEAIRSIGEPEEVFAFEDGNSRSQGTGATSAKESVKSFLSRPWRRNRNEAVLFGVCSGIAKEFGVDALWIRIIFILLTFLSGFGIFLYAVLIFLMESEPKTIVSDLHAMADRVWPEAREAGASGAMAIMGALWKFGELIVRVFSAIAGLASFFAAAALVVIMGVSHGNLVVGNMDIGASIPQVGYFALLAAFGFVFVLSICLFARMVGKRVWSVATFGLLMALLLVSVWLGTATVTEGISRYSSQAAIEKQFVLTGVTNGTYYLSHFDEASGPFPGKTIRILSQTWAATGAIVVETTITGWWENADQVKRALDHYIPMAGAIQGDEMVLTRKGRNLFDQKTPLIFPHESITIVTPPGIEVLQYRPYSGSRRYGDRPGAKKTEGYYVPQDGEYDGEGELSDIPQPPLPPGEATRKPIKNASGSSAVIESGR